MQKYTKYYRKLAVVGRLLIPVYQKIFRQTSTVLCVRLAGEESELQYSTTLAQEQQVLPSKK